MKIYDISQELFSSNVYPGDKKPTYIRISDMNQGAVCNVTEISMNAHNGTHMDAPRHFIKDGKTIDMLSLYDIIGKCAVVTAEGDITAEQIRKHSGYSRILFRGKCQLTEEAADILSECGIMLVGVESQSIATIEAPAAIHRIVLGQGVVALEGLVLTDVPDGEYFLFAAPIKLGGSDGSPCRAVLIDKIDTEN